MELKSDQMLQGGKYRIVEKIGQGGFAITYKAVWKTEITGAMGALTTDVTVAVKEFFFKDYCSRDANSSNVTITSAAGGQVFVKFKEKLKKEAAILSRLRHPNIVSVFDIFEENNTVYMVMEYVEGGSLKERIAKSGKLDEATVLRYTEQLCGAVTEIHRNNVLHLDIKPGNILIDPNNNVRLIDFGISKQYNSDTHAETSTTPVGISKGFAPPEQYTGVSQFSPATDVYAVGATIYNMLSGSVPPESMTLLENALPPIPGVSGKLWDAIVEAMSPLRPQRPQSAAELWELFENNAPTVVKPVEDDKTEVDISGVSSQPQDDKTVVESASETVDNSAYSTHDVENVSESDDTDEEEAGGKKKIWLWLLGVLAVAGIGIGAYFWLFFEKNPNNDIIRLNLKGDVNWVKYETRDTLGNIVPRDRNYFEDFFGMDEHYLFSPLLLELFPANEIKFNENGFIDYKKYFGGADAKYTYNLKNYITEIKWVVSEDEWTSTWTYIYGDSVTIEYDGFFEEEEGTYVIQGHNNQDGLESVVFQEENSSDMNVLTRVTREDGKVISLDCIDLDRENHPAFLTYYFSYNSVGDLSELIRDERNGGRNIWRFEYFDYDGYNNWTERHEICVRAECIDWSDGQRVIVRDYTREGVRYVTTREIGYR